MITSNKRDGCPLVVVRLKGCSVGCRLGDGFREDRSPFLELIALLGSRSRNSDGAPCGVLQNGDSGRAGQRTVLTGNKRDGSPLAVILVPLRPRISKFLTIIGFSVDTVCIRSRGRPTARSEVAGERCRADHAGGRRVGRGTINRPIAAAVLQSKPFHNGVACFVAPGAAVNLKGDLDLILVRDAVVIFVLLVINFQDVFFGLRAKLLGDDACGAIIDIAYRLVEGSISVDGFADFARTGDLPSGLFLAFDEVLDGVINLQLAEAIGIGYGVSTGHRRGGGGSIPFAAGLIISGVCLHAGGCGQRTFTVYIPLVVLVQRDIDDLVSIRAISPGTIHDLEGDLLLVLVRDVVRVVAVLAAALFVLLVVDVQDVLGRILDERQFKISGRSRGVENIVAACRLLIRGRDLVTDRAAAGFRLGLVFYIIYIIINSVVSRGGFRPLRVQIDVLLLDGILLEDPLRAVCAGVGGVPPVEGVAIPRGISRLGELIAGLQILLRMIGIRIFGVVPVIRRRICRRIPAVLLPDRIKRLGLGLAVASIEEDFLTFLAGVCARRIVRRACVRVLVPAEERVAVARRLIDAHIERILAVPQRNAFPRVRRRNANLLRACVAVICQRKAVVALVLGIGFARVRVIPLIDEIDASTVIGNLDRADCDRSPVYPLVLEDIAVIQRDFIGIEPRLARRHVIQPVKPIPVEADADLPELINLTIVVDVLADVLVPCLQRQPAVLDHEELLCLMQVGQVEAIGEEAVFVAEIVKDTARAALVGVNDQRVGMRELRPVCNHDFRILLADSHSALVAAAGNRCVAADNLNAFQIIQVSVSRVVFVVQQIFVVLVIAVCVDPSCAQLDVDVEGFGWIHRSGDGKALILQTRIVENRALDHAVAQTVGDNVFRLCPVITDQLILDRDCAHIGDQPDIIGILAGNGNRIRAALPVTGSRDNRSQIAGFCVLAIRKQYAAILLADVFAVHIDIDGTSLLLDCSL